MYILLKSLYRVISFLQEAVLDQLPNLLKCQLEVPLTKFSAQLLILGLEVPGVNLKVLLPNIHWPLYELISQSFGAHRQNADIVLFEKSVRCAFLKLVHQSVQLHVFLLIDGIV